MTNTEIENELLEMGLHHTIKINDCLTVTKVIGGWIYTYKECYCVFVPYSSYHLAISNNLPILKNEFNSEEGIKVSTLLIILLSIIALCFVFLG